ncbi:MAG TPA: bifunctional UDP-sugar hydrolase/5'-nucleotidase [Candidatus Cloacimonadota bacterium]|nr:bifunctional UDP-sugar hydrolase/5'-nucleotidase [Candidatus Cloacimonadota bacterium]HPK40407.1 bifunctional UDP-sugar hydrolase/5'-nucleotidase [Candidatus Cloacimonadota bacterium]
MKKILYSLIFLLAFSLWAEDLKLDILYTNDIHGGIDRIAATFMNPEFPPQLGGGASAATYIKEVRKLSDGKKRESFLFDVGDFFQGRPIGSLTNGEAIIEYMNAIEYDLTVIGNHEFDSGEETLINTLSKANFPALACNLFKKGTKELVDYVQPYLIFNKLGIKIGVIGMATSDTEKMSFPDHIKNVDFGDEKEALNKYIKILREEEKVDLLIVTMHAGVPFEPQAEYDKRYGKNAVPEPQYWGLDAQQLAHEVEGIDIIFGGHIHIGLAEPWVDPVTHTLFFSNYANGSNMGHITLLIDKETKTLAGFEYPQRDNALITLFEEQFIPDPEIDTMISARQAVVEKGMDDMIGTAGTFLSRASVDAQNAMGNFTCEAMIEATGADFSFLNLGGVRAEIPMGTVTYRQVFNTMPFDNQIVTILVDGIMLKKIIETRVAGSRAGLLQAGAKITYSRTRSDFDRVTRLEIGGEPWQANKIYKVATTDFLLQGNAGLTLLTTVPESQVIRNEINLRDAMVDYFKKKSPVKVVVDDRWIRDDRSKISPALQAELERIKE